MELKLYVTSSPVNQLDKVLTEERVENITLRRDFDILNPTITLKIEDIGYNYLYIDGLNRYYFVDEKRSINNEIIEFKCSVDLLMTYKDEIKNSHVTYKRKLRQGDTLSADLEFSVNTTSSIFESDKEHTGEGSIILTTIGEGA